MPIRKSALGRYAVDKLACMRDNIDALSAERGYGDSKVRSMVVDFNSLSFLVLDSVKKESEQGPEYVSLVEEAECLHKKSLELMGKVTETEESTSAPASQQK